MTILVIDGQGGRIGQQIVSGLSARLPQATVLAVGTNSIATAAMLKGGASQAATGENAVCVACRRADVIVGPLGIVIADALLGEITPCMAQAVGQSAAARVLIPMDRCNTLIAGAAEKSTAELVTDALDKVEHLLTVRRA